MIARVAVVTLCLSFCLSGTVAQDMPRGIRTAVKGSSSDMVVSWTTTLPQASIVHFGYSATNLSHTAIGSMRNYTTLNYQHDTPLVGLPPATQVYYSAGSASGGFSRVFSFKSPPKPDSPVSFAVYGDMGVKNSEGTVTQLLESLDTYDFTFYVGDASYADDRLTDLKGYEAIWDRWQEMLEPIAATKPLMTAPGNHDITCHSFGDWFCPKQLDNATAINYRFRMPAAESGANAMNMWYSFDYGLAHFIMLDTETDIGPKSPEGIDSIWHAGGFGDQIAWLKQDLAKATANRESRPWIIVGGHRPMYTTSKANGVIWVNATGRLRAQVETLLHDANVNAYMCGHVHAAERTTPIFQNQTTNGALTHFVVGGAGNVEGVSSWAPETPWLEWRTRDYGFGLVSIHNRSHASWSYTRGSDGAVLDRVELFNAH